MIEVVHHSPLKWMESEVLSISSDGKSTLQPPPDKFSSAFEPWGDYLFGSVMILIGKSN